MDPNEEETKKETMREELDFILRYSIDIVKYTPLKHIVECVLTNVITML